MNVDPCPIETPEDRARELAALRADNEETVRKLRLGAACDALVKCGLLRLVEGLHRNDDGAVGMRITHARHAVQALLRSDSDESRYAATGAALLALGALWAVS